ncbi:MAG: hypothetical protein HY683_03645 [Chloroflexi bacterium]|nr:hypothetical protein [Chloroflexota bacterium]
MGWKRGQWDGTREQLITWLANLKVEPYWVYNPEPGERIQFRGIPVPRRKTPFHGKALKGALRHEVLKKVGLLERYPALFRRDAVHTAAVLTNDLEGMVTTDQAFRQVAGLVVVDPAELASNGG